MTGDVFVDLAADTHAAAKAFERISQSLNNLLNPKLMKITSKYRDEIIVLCSIIQTRGYTLVEQVHEEHTFLWFGSHYAATIKPNASQERPKVDTDPKRGEV